MSLLSNWRCELFIKKTVIIAFNSGVLRACAVLPLYLCHSILNACLMCYGEVSAYLIYITLVLKPRLPRDAQKKRSVYRCESEPRDSPPAHLVYEMNSAGMPGAH